MQDPKNRQKFANWAPSPKFIGLHLRNQGMYPQSENFLNSKISPTCPRNMVNVGPLTAEIRSGVLANFNGFRVLAALYFTAL